MVPLHNEPREITQQVRLCPMLAQVRNGLINQHAGLLARPVRAKQRNEGGLAGRSILAHRLAGQFGIALVVQQIVGDLEGQAISRA